MPWHLPLLHGLPILHLKQTEYPFHPKWKVTVEQDGKDILLWGKHPDYYQPNRVLNIAHEVRSLSSVFTIDSKNVRLERYRRGLFVQWAMGIPSCLYRTF